MPLDRNDVVLFQGDSITNAFRMPGEISSAYQLGAGWAMIAAAKLLAERPGDGLRFINRGVSGDTVDRLAARWQADCLDLEPTVLSLLAGVNELNGFDDPAKRTTPQAFRERYRDLLVRTRAAVPAVRFILVEPFLLPVGRITPAHVDYVRERAAMVRSLAEEFAAAFVPLQDRFEAACEAAPPEHWLFDGIHPQAAGQWLIAQAWLEAAG